MSNTRFLIASTPRVATLDAQQLNTVLSFKFDFDVDNDECPSKTDGHYLTVVHSTTTSVGCAYCDGAATFKLRYFICNYAVRDCFVDCSPSTFERTYIDVMILC